MVPAPVRGRRTVGAVEMLDVRLGVRDDECEASDEAVEPVVSADVWRLCVGTGECVVSNGRAGVLSRL